MVRHSIRIAIVHLIFNGDRMKTYEVTTTVTITRKHIVEADGEETAKDQAEKLAMMSIVPYCHHLATIEQEAVEITSPNDEAKKYI